MNLENLCPQETVPGTTTESIEARNLAPAPRSLPEPTQDEFHSDLTKINQ